MEQKAVQLFNRGMNRDKSVSKADVDFAFENHNIRITARDHDTLLSVTNERGNKVVKGLHYDGYLIGWNVLNNYIILFTCDPSSDTPDRIYRVRYADEKFSSICIFSGNLNFSTKNPIESVVDYENDTILKIYWLDGRNVLRFLNFSDEFLTKHLVVSSTLENPVFDFVQDSFDSTRGTSSTPTVSITKTNDGNRRQNGVMQYFVTYYNKNGIQTGAIYSSSLVYLAPPTGSSSADGYNYNQVTIDMSDLDSTFDYVRVYAVLRTSLNITNSAFIVGESVINSGKAKIIDSGNTLVPIDITSLLYLGSKSVVASTLVQKDSTLFLGDLTSVGNQNIDAIEDAVKETAFVGGTFVENTSWESAIVSFEYSDNESDSKDIPYVSGSGLYPFNNQLNYLSSEITTFKGGEKYRFAVRFFRSNGESSKAFWIGDKVNSLYPKITEGSTIKRAVASCTLPISVVNAARSAGFVSAQLLIAEAMYSDRSVKAQGIVNPTVFNLLDRYKGAPYAQSSWMYRMFGGSYANNHFETLHKSNTVTAELQNSWWEDSAAAPSPLFITDSDGKVINTPYAEVDYDNLIVECTVYCQNWPRKYWGTLKITKIADAGGTETIHEKTYNIGGGAGTGETSRKALFADWLEAYEDSNVPVTQRAKTEDMNNLCEEAYDAIPDIGTPGTAEYRLPEGSGSVPINYNTSDLNNTFSTNSREYFFTDNSVVTLNSPEIEYEAVNIDRFSSLKFRIVGVSRVTGNISDYEMTADDFEYPGSRVLDFKLSVPNINNYLKAITARPIYLEHGKVITGSGDSEEEAKSVSPYGFMAYMWHKAGSIPELTLQEKKISILKRKMFANMYFSYYTVYNNYQENVWSVSPTDIRQFDAVSEQLYEIGVGTDKKIYAGNVDKMVTMPMGAKYPIFYSKDIGYDAELLSLSKYDEGTDAPVQITYHSKPHAVITLPVENGVDTILPYMYSSDRYELNKTDDVDTFGPYIPWGPKNHSDKYIYRECTSSESQTSFAVGSYDNLSVVGLIDTTNSRISLYKGFVGTVVGKNFEAFNTLVKAARAVSANTPVYMMAYFTQSGSSSSLSPLLVNVSNAELTSIDAVAEWESFTTDTTDTLTLNIKSSGAGMSSISYSITGWKVSGTVGFAYTGTVTKEEAASKAYKIVKEFPRNGEVNILDIQFRINFYGDTVPMFSRVNENAIKIQKSVIFVKDKVQVEKSYDVAFVVKDTDYLNQRTATSPIELVNLFDQRIVTVNASSYSIGKKSIGIPYPEPTQLKYELDSPFVDMDSQYVYIGELYEDFDAVAALDPKSDTRYGGISEAAVEGNTFIPAGSKINLTADSSASLIGNEGDTFFQRWDSIKAYPRSADDINQVLNGLSVMLETHINLEGRNDVDRGVTHLTDINVENFGTINPVFTQSNNFSKSYDTDESLNLDTYRNAVTWTMQKSSNAETDEWTHITLADFLAMDGDNGKLNALRRFKNSIIAFQDKGIAEILFNSRVQIQTTEGVPVEIANSGKVDGKRYITTQYGTMNKWSIIEGRTGLFFIDNRNKIIGLFNGNGIENLSVKSQLDAWVRNHNSLEPWNPEDDNNAVAFYDSIHSDVYFINSSNQQQPCLVYSEILGGFVGFYDYSKVPMMVNVADKFISYHRVPKFGDSSLWIQNEGLYCDIFGDKKDFWITWRVTPDNHTDKIWTNLEFRADFTRVLNSVGDSIVDEQDLISGDTESVVSNKTFDAFEVWNEYQTTGEQAIPKRTYSSIPDMYPDSNKRFRIWRMDIPRAIPDVTRGNKFGLDRIRNPWVYVKLKKNSGNFDQDMMQLHDVIVKYFSDK